MIDGALYLIIILCSGFMVLRGVDKFIKVRFSAPLERIAKALEAQNVHQNYPNDIPIPATRKRHAGLAKPVRASSSDG